MNRFHNLLVSFVATLATITFFFTVTASADGDHDNPTTTAEQASESKNDETVIRNFVLHAKSHAEENPSDLAKRAEFYRQARTSGTTWKHDSAYLIMLRRNGTVINHGLYTEALFGDSLAELPTVKKLVEKLESANGQAVCEPYEYKGATRQACAVDYVNIPSASAQRREGTAILIGGFDHSEENEDIVRLDCTDYEPAVTATEVKERQTRESLKDFVEGAIIRFSDALELLESGEVGESTKIIQCFSKTGYWKDNPIYLFVMTSDTTVVLNGLNQELAGSPFRDVFDEDGVDIGKEIINTGGQNGDEGFVEYKWDDPSVDGDEVNETGKSPGTSPKISYIKGKSFHFGPPQVYIFGSGIYPKDDDSDNDGCAIARSGSTPGNTGFNMLLILFSMILMVSLRGFRVR